MCAAACNALFADLLTRLYRDFPELEKWDRGLLVGAGLDFVAEASARMGRKDWALLVGGVMLAWLLESLVPPETVQHIFSTLSEGVRHLVEGEPWAGLTQLPRGP
jgi:hypothetical protein